MPYAHITGWGMAVPEKVLTNEDLEKMVDTSDEWIQSRTGIRERRIVDESQSTSSLGVDAALKALDVANVKPANVDLIICSTSSPEYIFPATASIIQDHIGATNAGAFDLLAACTGFVYALNMAAQAVRTGSINTALVIGSESLSRFTNWKDRNTCILFGDGAGAFVVEASDEPGGILSSVLHSDGSGADLLTIPASGSRNPATEATIQAGLHYIHMDGKEVYRFATRAMAQSTKEALARSGLTLDDIQWIIPHQANYRIIEAAARNLKLPMDRFVVNVDRFGNTSTASVPIATCEAIEDGRLKVGNRVVFVGFGGGLTWAALVAEWTGPSIERRKIDPRRYRMQARMRSFLRRLWRFIEGIVWGRHA